MTEIRPFGSPPARARVLALSIRQPWAELIVRGDKAVENRSWSTRWRGLLVIHAGQRWDELGWLLAAARGIPLNSSVPRGYVGVAELVGVHPDRGCCRPWGQSGGFHWRLARPRRLRPPAPGPGRLGLYRPPDAVYQQVAIGDANRPGDNR